MKRFISILVCVLFLSAFFSIIALAESDTEELSDASDITETSGTDKAFQTASLVIMTAGILGLPAYFFLNARKKRLLREYEEKNHPQNDDNISDAEESIENTKE